MGSEAKYHHLIPQIYISGWANSSGTLLVKDLCTEKIENKNKENILGVNHYHSIIAGMPICTEDDAKEIFTVLNDYEVCYQGRIIVKPLELNRLYFDFDNWIITRKSDGSLAKKKLIKDSIDKVKIRDIETTWATKYENRWPVMREEIEKQVLYDKNGEVSEQQRDFLMRFYTSMDWRGFATNWQFSQCFDTLCKDILAFDKIEIPVDERGLPIFETLYEYYKPCLLLEYFRSFLNDDGPIFSQVNQNIKFTSFHFLIADGPTFFNTSDNPSFCCTREDGLRIGLMPIEPRILMAQGKMTDNDQVYLVTHITDDAVKKYNVWIEENAEQYIILDNTCQ